MSKRTVFTSITPLPVSISRETAIGFLHDHTGMIDLGPLVTKRYQILPPKHALPEEQHCAWYAITDKVSYLPGGLVTGEVEFTAAFHDLPMGLQTHVYAPMGLDLREKWTVGGTLPGEAPEPMELGLEAPPTGLYIREDVDMRCSIVMAAFVKKTLKKAHETAVETLIAKAQVRAMLHSTIRDSADPSSPLFSPGWSSSSSSSASSSSPSSLRPPLPSDRRTSWGGAGGRDHRRASPDDPHSYGRQALENSAMLRHQNLYPHSVTKPLY